MCLSHFGHHASRLMHVGGKMKIKMWYSSTFLTKRVPVKVMTRVIANREGPPDHRPSRPGANFFFGIFLSETKDHIVKLINPKYYVFLTYLWKMPRLTIFKFLRVDHKNAKISFFHILIVFWDFLRLCSSPSVGKGLKMCRKEFSTKRFMSTVIQMSFSKRSVFRKGSGVYG